MSDTRHAQRRGSTGGSDPAARGLILVVVAVVLGAILLAAGGTVGFDADDTAVDIGDNGGDGSGTAEESVPTDETTETTEAPPVTVAPAEVSVVVANGAGIAGLAGGTAEFLATQGYSNTTATDAVSSVSSTVVYFAEGFQPNAEAIATLFALPPEQVQALPAEPVANDQPPEAAVVLVVGADAEAVVNGGGSAGTTTATSEPG